MNKAKKCYVTEKLFRIRKYHRRQKTFFLNAMFLQNFGNHKSSQLSLICVNYHDILGKKVEWFPVVFSAVLNSVCLSPEN